MKRIHFSLFIFCFIYGGLHAQTLSPRVTASGGGYATSVPASLSWTMGETNINTLQSGATILSQGFQQPEVNLNTILKLNLFIQGYYRSIGSATPMNNIGHGGCLYVTGVSSYPTEVDTITISLEDSTTQSQVGASVKGIVHTDGTVWQSYSPGVSFPGSVAGKSYYIKMTHRNAIETWSGKPVPFNSTPSYDFSTSRSQAYGNNMVKVDTKGGQDVFALWNGDVFNTVTGKKYSQDGVIESADYALVEEDYTSVLFGYYPTDVTGDGTVESADYSLIEQNYSIIIFKAAPW